MTSINNETFSVEELSLFEQKVEMGILEVNDYKRLNTFLTQLGLTDYLLNRLKELNIYSFEEYVLAIKNERNSMLEAKFKGSVFGVISVLKSFVK